MINSTRIITNPITTGSRTLTHFRPAMPFGNRKIYFKGSFQFSIVTIEKISPLWKPEI